MPALQVGMLTMFAAAGALASGLVAITAVQRFGALRTGLSAIAMLLLLVTGFASPRRQLLFLVTWLVVVGLGRRLLLLYESRLETDPLLLVAPAVLLLLVLAAVRRGALRSHTPLSVAVLVFSALTLAEAFNPLQGNAMSGLAGLLFFLVPQLGFWIGRGVSDDVTFALVMKLLAVLALLAALYGFVQTFVGFPPWDQAWIDLVKPSYTALGVRGTIRPFGSFSAASEYASFLAVGILAWLAFGTRKRWRLVAIPAAGVLFAALVLASTRGLLVTLLVTLALIAASRIRLPLPLAAIGAATVLVLLPAAVTHAAPATFGHDPAGALVGHDVQGLADPFGRHSTLPLHLADAAQGLTAGISQPLGHGVGTVTLAAKKFGELKLGSEADPSNAAVALGLPGLLIYLVIVLLGISAGYRLALKRRDVLALIGLGIPVVLLLRWLSGGQYAVAFLPWLALGWVDSRRAVRPPAIR